jgi:hypothetical protein
MFLEFTEVGLFTSVAACKSTDKEVCVACKSRVEDENVFCAKPYPRETSIPA